MNEVACSVDYFFNYTAVSHVFSLPFKFNRLEKITNNFPSFIFNSVTHLGLRDHILFTHEFFIQIAHDFPLLRSLLVMN